MLQLSGVWNLRDVGGLTTSNGAMVRAGRFLRSGQLSGIDDAGQRMLIEIGIGDIADRARHTRSTDTALIECPSRSSSTICRFPTSTARAASRRTNTPTSG
jgi:protein-tyrosine phosphatase